MLGFLVYIVRLYPQPYPQPAAVKQERAMETEWEPELRGIRDQIAREKDIAEAQALTAMGRLAALSLAVDALIDMTPSPGDTRAKIGESIRGVWRVFSTSENTNHQVMAIGLQDELERITGAA
jgi:hypothetical protein